MKLNSVIVGAAAACLLFGCGSSNNGSSSSSGSTGTHSSSSTGSSTTSTTSSTTSSSTSSTTTSTSSTSSSTTSSSSGSTGSSSSTTTTGSSGSTSSSGSGSSSGSSTGGTLGLIDCDVDGGPACGTADLGVDSASLASNPNDVLTAIANVQAHGAVSVEVLYQADGGSAQAGPSFTIGSTAETLPVLGLSASTDYAMQLLVASVDGGTARSPVLGFSTAALPSEVENLKGFTVSVDTGAYQPGYVMVSKLVSLGAALPLPIAIVDRAGNIVWYSDETLQPAGDFQKWRDGTYSISVGDTGTILNRHVEYRQRDVLGNLLHTWTVPDIDGGTDNHEAQLLPDGQVLMIGMTYRTQDLTPYGGPDGGSYVVGNTIYTVKADGGGTLVADTFDFASPADIDTSVQNINNQPFDEVHGNSVDLTSDGNYLLSARHLSQVFKINATTGARMWTLGHNGDFTIVNDPLNGFSGQHFAHETTPDHVLLFDDGDAHSPALSRAVEYALAFDGNGNPTTATLVWSYTPSPSIYSFALGSAQRLPNGNTIVTFGTTSRIDEVDPNGNLVWQLTDTHPGFGYYRGLWIPTLY